MRDEGINASTRGRGPWEVIYKEDGFVTRNAALIREKQLKSLKGGDKLKQLLNKRV